MYGLLKVVVFPWCHWPCLRLFRSSFLQYQCLYCCIVHLEDEEISQEHAEVYSEKRLWCVCSTNSKITSASVKNEKKKTACFPRILLDAVSPWLPGVKVKRQKQIVSARRPEKEWTVVLGGDTGSLRWGAHPHTSTSGGATLLGPLSLAEWKYPSLQPDLAHPRLQWGEELLRNEESDSAEVLHPRSWLYKLFPRPRTLGSSTPHSAPVHFHAWTLSASVCWSCLNEVLQTGWLTHEVYCLTILEAGSPKSRLAGLVSSDSVLLKDLLCVKDAWGHSLACRWSSSPCVFTLFFLYVWLCPNFL